MDSKAEIVNHIEYLKGELKYWRHQNANLNSMIAANNKRIETISRDIADNQKALKSLKNDVPKRGDKFEYVGAGPYSNSQYIVAGIGGKHGLVNLQDGQYWAYPDDDITKIFGVTGKDKFKKIS